MFEHIQLFGMHDCMFATKKLKLFFPDKLNLLKAQFFGEQNQV